MRPTWQVLLILHEVNLDFGSTSFMAMAIWVVVIGAIGQNLASYTAILEGSILLHIEAMQAKFIVTYRDMLSA